MDAVGAAAGTQRAIASHAWPEGAAPNTRMGLHSGEPALTADGYVGLDVHRAARLCAAAHGGQVLLTQATQALVAHDLPDGVSLRDLGEHRLRDLQYPEHVFQLVVPDLPADFPPLRTEASHPGATSRMYPANLPSQPTPFIGREREVQEVRQRLLDPAVRLVTLRGPGGMGKTRLAIEVAGHVLDEFSDGVWFVELAPISDSGLVGSAIATTLGVKEAGREPLLDSLKAYLHDKHLLLELEGAKTSYNAAKQLMYQMSKEGMLLVSGGKYKPPLD